jgi:hypothetical protein
MKLAAAASAAWLVMFSVYRYPIPLEMLHLLIVLAIMLWPITSGCVSTSHYAGAAVGGDHQSDGAAGRAVRACANISLPDAQYTMVLMAGTAPMVLSFSFLLRFHSAHDGPSHDDPWLARQMFRVAQHTAIYLVFAEW